MGERSLSLFTLLAQTVFGALITLTGVQLLGDTDVLGFGAFFVIGLLLLVAATISTLHLGSPAHAPYAITNLRTSWLSREILGLGLTGGFVALGGLVAMLARDTSTGTARTAISLLAAVCSAFLVLAMVQLYSVRTIPEWLPSRTWAQFGGSSLRLGSVLGTVLIAAELLPDGSVELAALWPLLLLATGVGLWFAVQRGGLDEAEPDRRAGALLVRGTRSVRQAEHGHGRAWFAFGISASAAGTVVLGVGPAWLAGVLALVGLCTLFPSELATRDRFYETAPSRGRDARGPEAARRATPDQRPRSKLSGGVGPSVPSGLARRR